jgi:crossover junction endodeoxyribonuclease RuvC
MKEIKQKTCLGLDLSLNSTGVAVLDLKSGNPLYVMALHPPKDMKGEARLVYLRYELKAMLKKWRPSVVALEGYGYSPNRANQDALIEWGGIVKVMLHEMGFPFMVIAPTSLKKFVLGPTKKGGAGKDAMRLGVYKRWGVEYATSDEVDAFALAQASRAAVRPSLLASLPKWAAETLKKARFSLFYPFPTP